MGLIYMWNLSLLLFTLNSDPSDMLSDDYSLPNRSLKHNKQELTKNITINGHIPGYSRICQFHRYTVIKVIPRKGTPVNVGLYGKI